MVDTIKRHCWVQLTLSYFRAYIYVKNPKTMATPVRIYTYTDFAIEIWGFYRRLTDTLRYHHTRKKSGVYSELSAVFWRVLANNDCRTKFNSSLGMEYNGELYGFSAVKVKLVDSLI